MVALEAFEHYQLNRPLEQNIMKKTNFGKSICIVIYLILLTGSVTAQIATGGALSNGSTVTVINR